MTDLKLAFRQLCKCPGFTAVAVLTLALGIGANLALFTVLDEEFLRPRPVLHPEELWVIRPSDISGQPRFFNLSRPYYEAIRKYNHVFRGVVGYQHIVPRLQMPDGSAEVNAELVSGEFFSFLGVKPVLGRGFVPAEDDKPGAPGVAVISHQFWQQHFAGDPQAIGKTLALDNQMVEVIGVAPPGFNGINMYPRDLWMPASMDQLFGWHPMYTLLGRLDGSINPAAAADSLAPIVQEVTKTLHPPASDPDRGPREAGNNSEFTRVALLRAGYGTVPREFAYNDRGALIRVNSLAAFGTLLVLLIAASNLANLLLARALNRRKELATRLALGATRWALVRQLTMEGVLLAALGSIGALVMLTWFNQAVPAMMSAVVYGQAPVVSLHPDVRVIMLAVASALVVGVGSSVLPALQATRFDPFGALKDPEGVGGARTRWWSMRNLLVVAQVAASLVLLSGVCLCLRGLQQQLRSEVGFRPELLAVAALDLERAGYTTNTAPLMCETLRQGLSLLPGVQTVGMMDGPPFSGERGELVTSDLEGHEGVKIEFGFASVGPECFHALGIPILAGREVTTGDFALGRRVALVSNGFAKEFWPNEEPLGKELKFRRDGYEVIGVVGDARLESLTKVPRPTVYFAARVQESLHPTFILRTKERPEALINSFRAELLKANARFRDSFVVTVGGAMRDSLTAQRNVMRLLGELAVVAVGLTVLGAYGVMSYRVTQRTREIGIRLAVGARRADIAKLVFRFGVWLALAGICLGLPAAVCGAVLLRHLVLGISPFDLPAFGLASVAVTLALFLACWLPARRAAKVDPIEALRYE
jgi:predicted permease